MPPKELIDYTVRLVEGDSAAKDVRIRTSVQKGLKPVLVDSQLMTNVLLNLVLNALKALPEGGSLTVGAGRDSRRGVTELWVEDEGPGIPAEYQESIFDPFFTRSSGGTGLGLAIARRDVENHGGGIRVTSPLPGKQIGARFTVSLP